MPLHTAVREQTLKVPDLGTTLLGFRLPNRACSDTLTGHFLVPIPRLGHIVGTPLLPKQNVAGSNPVSRSKLEVTLRRTPNWVSCDFSGPRFGGPPLRRAWRRGCDSDEKGAGRPGWASGSFSSSLWEVSW
jgi:hypothetical protein